MKVELKGELTLYPCPVVLVTCVDGQGKPNIITLAWAGVASSDPRTLGVSIRPGRHSHRLIKESGEFVVNVPTTDLLRECDYCGVVSGKEVDKFEKTGLTPVPAKAIHPPLIEECPVNLECRLLQIVELGVHHLFLGEIVARHISQDALSPDGKPDFAKMKPLVFASPGYWSLGSKLEKIGFTGKKL